MLLFSRFPMNGLFQFLGYDQYHICYTINVISDNMDHRPPFSTFYLYYYGLLVGKVATIYVADDIRSEYSSYDSRRWRISVISALWYHVIGANIVNSHGLASLSQVQHCGQNFVFKILYKYHSHNPNYWVSVRDFM